MNSTKGLYEATQYEISVISVASKECTQQQN